MPTADILMQSRNVAMAVDGMWNVARFDDLAAVERYLAHPAHVAAVAVASPLVLHVAEHDHVVEP